MTEIKLFVATPCFGGLVYKEYMTGLLNLQEECIKKGIKLKVLTLGKESLITRARNICVSYFLDDPEEYTHLLFIDADIGFDPKNVFRLLELDEEVSCGIYPKKEINWEKVHKLSRESPSGSHLQAKALMYNLSFPNDQEVAVKNGFVEVLDGATGFMLIKRRVFGKMKVGYPDLKYTADHMIDNQMMESDNSYLFFDCMKDPKSGRYLSEDYTFCRRWQAIEGKIFADIAMPLEHIGTYSFKGHVGSRFQMKK